MPMETDDLWALMKPMLDEIKAAQHECNIKVAEINGTVKTHSWQLKTIYWVFGGAWAVFLVWLKSAWGGR